MDSKSRNCASCTRNNKKCEKRFHSDKEWSDLQKAEDKINKEIHNAEVQSAALFAKIVRLQKQRQFLKERGSKMLDHDSNVLDILDEEDPEDNPPATPPTEQQLNASAHNFLESEFPTLSSSDVEAWLANPGLPSLGDSSFSFFADNLAVLPRPREGSR